MMQLNAFDLKITDTTDVRIQFMRYETALLVVAETGAVRVTLKPDQLQLLLEDVTAAIEQHGNS